MPRATVDDVRRAHRILLYGVTGSGKSTAALRLGQVLGLPAHLVDEEIGWLPGWSNRPDDDMRELAAKIAVEPCWVLDSAYGTFRDIMLDRTQVVVALDYPRWLSLFRLIRRTLHRVVTREAVCNGNVETVRHLLSRDSIVAWHFRSFARKRDAMRTWQGSPMGVPVLRLSHPRELEVLIAELHSLRGAPNIAIALRETALEFGGLDDLAFPPRDDVARAADLEQLVRE